MKYIYHIGDEFYNSTRFIDGAIEEGTEVLVVSLEDMMTGDEEFYISDRFAAEGFPGNMDSSDKCFHGWRGTTNNVRIEAHGVYRVKSVKDIRYGDRQVELERKDLRKPED